MKRLLPPLIAIAAMLFSTPILACQFYVGAHTGGALVDTRSTAIGLSADGATTSGLLNATIGCDQKLGKDWVAGIWADADLYGVSRGSVLPGISGATPDKGAAIGGKLGYQVNPYVLAYGVGGYGWLWEKNISNGAISLSMPDFRGPLAGLGFDTKLSKNLHLDVQYRAQFVEAQAVTGAGLSAQPIDHTLRVGLNFYFNGEAPAAPKPHVGP